MNLITNHKIRLHTIIYRQCSSAHKRNPVSDMKIHCKTGGSGYCAFAVAVRLDKNGERKREWHAASIPSSLPYWLQKCPPWPAPRDWPTKAGNMDIGKKRRLQESEKWRENPPINHDSQRLHYPLPKSRFSIVAASLSALPEGLRQHGR